VTRPVDRPRAQPPGLLILWLLFLALCFGLGYPTLRRYDPRDPRTNFDGTTAMYHWQVTGDPQEGSWGPSVVHFRYRLLVPLVARPFYLMGKGHIGTWDPGYFGLLMANSIFCASTALLLFLVALGVLGSLPLALAPALLYLLSFAVPNDLLAGLVDSGEAFLLMAVVWCLSRGRWAALPCLGIAGALAKETCVAFSVALAFGWCAADWRAGDPSRPWSRPAWVAALGAAGLATLTAVFSIANGRVVLPWQLALSGNVYGAGLGQRALRLTEDLGLVYTFGWLGPLGAPGLSACPRGWRVGALLSASTAIGLGILNGEPGLSRSLFNILGPLLSLGAAVTVSGSIAGRRV
jgi:hypothetical protein